MADLAGEYVIALVVSNGTEDSSKATIVITATTKPVADAGSDRTVGVNSVVVLDGSNSSDAENDPLTYTWSITDSPSGSNPTLTGATSIDPGFTPDIAGTYEIQLIVSDGEFESTADTVSITATERPIADAGGDRTVVLAAPVTLNGSGSTDPDGDPLAYTWTLESNPAGSGAAFQVATLVNPEFTPDLAGEYTISLIVSDGTEDSTKATIVITATTKPVADAGEDRAIVVNSFAVLDGSNSADADNDPLTYSWAITNSPSGSNPTLTGATSVDPGFNPDITGTYTITLIVSDSEFVSMPDTVIITATERPVADAGNERTVVVGTAVTLDGSGSLDSGTGQLTYRWRFIAIPGASSETLDNDTTVNPDFTADTAGSYVIELIVDNGITESAPDIVVVSTLPESTVNGLGMTFQNIPAGTFQRGNYQVTLIQPFDIQTTELTHSQWKSTLDLAESLSIGLEGLSKTPSSIEYNPTCPVDKVSWDDIKTFIGILNQLGEGTYRLPTEAEWEYACRSESTTKYANGNDAADLALIGWYNGNSSLEVHSVALLDPNAWGLYDMHGNVFEWCEDLYGDGDYPSGDVTDPTGSTTGTTRVTRGGAWNFDAPRCQSDFRKEENPDVVSNIYGFRLHRTP